MRAERRTESTPGFRQSMSIIITCPATVVAQVYVPRYMRLMIAQGQVSQYYRNTPPHFLPSIVQGWPKCAKIALAPPTTKKPAEAGFCLTAIRLADY